MTATCATVTLLAARIEHVGNKLHMDNFLSSPALFDDQHNQTIHCCGTVTLKGKGMPKNFGHKMKMKRGDLNIDMEGILTAKVGKNRQSVHTQTNMHYPPLEGSFCDKHGTAVKLAIIQDSNRHVGYVDKSDCMTNPYSISRRTSKWKNEISSTFWTLAFSTAVSFSPLGLQIMASTFHTDIGEGPNTRGRKGASTSNHKT